MMPTNVTPDRCNICGGLLSWGHDHRDDFTGLDDGPYRESRTKKRQPSEIADIRRRAWETRRTKYGPRGHK